MIEINLVPPHLRKRKRSPKSSLGLSSVSKEKLLGFGGGFIILLLAVHIFLQVIIFVQYARFKSLKGEWDKIAPEKQNVDRIITELRSLQGKEKSLQELVSDKGVLWSKKLNEISDSVPRGLWLSKITLKDNVLWIDGSAVSKYQDEIINVHSFAANLKSQKHFMDNFTSFEMESIQRKNIKTVEIADFSVRAKMK